MKQLECKNLCLGYEGNEIMHDLNFEVNEGDYLCIVGENGSGKSTLMRTILGLQSPMSGQVVLGDGKEKLQIGYLPQQTLVQKDFPATVWEIVLSGCQGRCGKKAFYSAEDKALAEEKIKKMGIEHLRNKCYREMSGGQQQRTLLARALCATGSIILLDEPVSGLDPTATEEMYSLIKGLNEEGITVIMISHDVDAVLDYATNILRIGHPIFFGTKAEYIESESSELAKKGGRA